MAQNVNPTFVKTPNNGLGLISSGSSNSSITVYTGGVSGSKIVSVIATASTGAATVDVQTAITNGGTVYAVGIASVPQSAGYASSVAAVNLLVNSPGLPFDSDGNPYLILKSTADTLTVKQPTTVITAGQINIIAIIGDF
jgi:hypothetical protein